MWKYFLVSVFCLCAPIRQSSCQAVYKDITTNAVFRLSGTTVPDQYDLRFEFQDFNGVDNLTFSGVANINIIVVSFTNVVTLNLRDLNVTNVTVADITSYSTRYLLVSEWVYLANDEQFEIRLDRTVPPGKHLRVSIMYVGNIRTDMTGLYLSSYEELGTTKYVYDYYFDNLCGEIYAILWY